MPAYRSPLWSTPSPEPGVSSWVGKSSTPASAANAPPMIQDSSATRRVLIPARHAPVRLLAVARTTNPNEEQQKRVVQVVSACLDEQSPVVQFGAVGALGQLGKAASSAVPALNALASHHPMDGLRDSAKQAVKQIESNTPPPVEVTRLREELERLKKSQDDLQERLNRFEKTKPVSKEGQTK